jgi:hypothetical protein
MQIRLCKPFLKEENEYSLLSPSPKIQIPAAMEIHDGRQKNFLEKGDG